MQVNAPTYANVGVTYTVTAEVQNTGKNAEANVNLSLQYNGIQVGQTTIANLEVNASETLTFSWTPTTTGTYNFTACTPSVLGELYVEDNVAERILYIFNVTMFDGMVLHYSFFVQQGMTNIVLPFDLAYSQRSDTIFRATSALSYMGSVIASFWDEDVTTRMIKNAGGNGMFGYGNHTPFWIFTNVTVGEIVPISVDGVGGHLFTVTGEQFLDLAAIGRVEVWVLSDTTTSGGIAYFEKATGLLVKGTFHYSMSGTDASYTLKLQGTNARPTWVQVPTNQEIEQGTALTYDVNAQDANGIDHYSVNDTIHFAVDVNGLITSAASLTPGEYGLEIRAYGLAGNYCSAIITVTVKGGIPFFYYLVILGVVIGVSAAVIVIIVRRKHRGEISYP
ncbi:MAG: Serine proteinase (Modular protein) [Promethearchaeota archaeon CR_4]|nr:MAG: Serine proteinase (Modular protein) [Candidatus Lokiarchaeota archaeon CR_4]